MPLLSKVNAGNSRVANSRVSSIFAKKVSQKIKRARPSHKPHPKATCPHPTRPLRPPGRRARDDYAQLVFKMQPHLYVFSVSSSPIIFPVPDARRKQINEIELARPDKLFA